MSDELFTKASKAEQDLKWARIWFKKFAAFHSQSDHARNWDFTADHVIQFLRSKRDRRTPAWKRMKVLEGLMNYRRLVQEKDTDFLRPIRDKMKEIVILERARDEGFDEIEDVVGEIDPSEADAIQEFRRAIRKQGLKLQTERSYVSKLRAFMADRGLTCLADFQHITGDDVEAHLTDLAVDGNVAPSTQNTAFHGLLKFFELVLKRDMGKIQAIRAKKHKYIPTVMSTDEVKRVLDGLHGQHLAIAKLLYGCGMRISEAIRLRVKDLDFDNRLIEIRESKGDRSRHVPMPEDLVPALQRFMTIREAMHEQDLADGTASVWMPHAQARKWPNAHKEFRWQFLFASHRLSRDPKTGRIHRHHINKDTFPRHLRIAVEGAGINKHVTSHTFRHCYATHLLRTGVDIRTIQELLGHQDVKTTMIYTHVAELEKVVSPLDVLVA